MNQSSMDELEKRASDTAKGKRQYMPKQDAAHILDLVKEVKQLRMKNNNLSRNLTTIKDRISIVQSILRGKERE